MSSLLPSPIHSRRSHRGAQRVSEIPPRSPTEELKREQAQRLKGESRECRALSSGADLELIFAFLRIVVGEALRMPAISDTGCQERAKSLVPNHHESRGSRLALMLRASSGSAGGS